MGRTTSKNASSLKSYLDEYDDLPADALLGRIVLFTITDEPVSLSDLTKWFDDAGLDKSYPRPTRRSTRSRRPPPTPRTPT